MRHHLVLVWLLATFAAACAATPDAGSPATTQAAQPSSATTSTVAPPDAAETPATNTSTTQPATPTTQSDRQAAPDFTLELSDGTTFVLSEEQKPVYLVFWAEW